VFIVVACEGGCKVGLWEPSVGILTEKSSEDIL
jgi:hypothetical protein